VERGGYAFNWLTCRLGGLIGAALISAAISLDGFIIASFTIGCSNTLSAVVCGKLRATLGPLDQRHRHHPAAVDHRHVGAGAAPGALSRIDAI
jgi:hypothetical protein